MFGIPGEDHLTTGLGKGTRVAFCGLRKRDIQRQYLAFCLHSCGMEETQDSLCFQDAGGRWSRTKIHGLSLDQCV